MSQKRSVAVGEAGQRLDQLLSSWLPGVSRSRVQQWLRQGLVLVDGRSAKASERLGEGQEIGWEEPDKPAPMDMSGAPVHELVVLHEDEHLIAINKTAGLLAHRNHLDQADSVVELAAARFGALPEPEQKDPHAVARAGLVHRLDRGTSGIMLLARTPEALAQLQAQFAERSVTKRYTAFVHRSPRFDSETVDAAIEVDPRQGDRRRVVRGGEDEASRGKPAATQVDVLDRYRGAAKVECLPRTGRTHQIRVHLLHLGLPIIGDRTYRWPGALPDPLEEGAPIPARPALHAASIEVAHPGSGERMRFEAPLPEDMQRLEAWLEQNRPLGD